MTETGYASGMGTTPPSEPSVVNVNALEGFMRAFDRVLAGKYDLSGGAMVPVQKPLTVQDPTPKPMVVGHHRKTHLSIWHTFPPLKFILRIRDNIRLRRYNREWIKNNIH